MKYAIVYSSKTGNTKLLAQAVAEALPREDCIYFGEPDTKALEAETIYLGFWTDKGSCDESCAEFLKKVTTQKVFLFGTAGFGGAPAYFQQILGRVKANLGPGVTVTGSFMCQGKMPMSVRERYMQMEDSPRRSAMLANFDAALSHPDGDDLARLKAAVAGAE